MPEHKALYKWSLSDATNMGEDQLWQESHNKNCLCARAIESAISDNYADNRLNTDVAKEIIETYGFDRVNYVLANTVQRSSHDGRFDAKNKEWADNFYIPKEDASKRFYVKSHPGLTNLFLNRVRKEWDALGLFDRSHCTDNEYYEDKLLVMRPSTLKDQYKTPDYQLFFATSGFGCDPHKTGTQVGGYFLKDGEYAHFRRADFIGEIKPEYIPEWAKAELKNYIEPEEDTGIKMEGV